MTKDTTKIGRTPSAAFSMGTTSSSQTFSSGSGLRRAPQPRASRNLSDRELLPISPASDDAQ